MILAAFLLALAQTPAQATSVRLPPANALPPPAGEEAAVLVPVDALFAALAARDGQAALAHVDPKGNLAVATEQPDGTRTIVNRTWAEFADHLKPGPERYEERLINPAIEIDGDLAMVWGAYVFNIDGKLHHCGVDHFSLVRADGRWKILNLAWTSRTTGCQ
jgi:hypothetical protein